MGKVSNNDLISIVVPIYNVELYLEKCIKSILVQTYKDIEIILVNDGSTDNCREICEKYCEKDSRIRIFNKENGGLSDARNFGIMESKGKYITFIDSDDYIEPDYIEYLYNLIKKYNTKISCCGHYICYDGKKKIKTSSAEQNVLKEDALNFILYDTEIDICSWGKMYETSLFNKIKFPKGKIFEDTATTYLLFDECNYISVGKECKYNYVMRNNSITSKKFNINKMDLIEMTNMMCEYINKKYPNLKSASERRKMWAYLSTYTKIIYTEKNDYLREKQIIKDYISFNKKNVLSNKKISKRDKFALIIYSFGDNVFKFVWSLYKKNN